MDKIQKTSLSGFTMVELLLTVTLFLSAFGMGIVFLGNFLPSQALNTGGERLIQGLREAHRNATTQFQNSAWGVYLDNTSDPHRFVVFSGNNYSGRTQSLDQINFFQKVVDYHSINIQGGGNEIVFSRGSGFTSDIATIQLKAQSETQEVTVNAKGVVDYGY